MTAKEIIDGLDPRFNISDFPLNMTTKAIYRKMVEDEIKYRKLDYIFDTLEVEDVKDDIEEIMVDAVLVYALKKMVARGYDPTEEQINDLREMIETDVEFMSKTSFKLENTEDYITIVLTGKYPGDDEDDEDEDEDDDSDDDDTKSSNRS